MGKSHRLLLTLALAVGCHGLAGCSSPAPDTSPARGDAAPSGPDCCPTESPSQPGAVPVTAEPEVVRSGVSIPDVTLTDQDGRSVTTAEVFRRDQLVVLNVIFTTCKGICPPMGVNFGQLQSRLGKRLGADVKLISVSVDPVTDTPERLKAWARQFDAGPAWTLLTGPKQEVDRLLKGLGMFTADKTNHSPLVLIGRVADGRWQRVHGLTSVDGLSEIVRSMLDAPPAQAPNAASAAQKYFTDVPLVDQHGKTVRLYSDVIHGKVIVAAVFFTSCRATCPRLIDTLVRLQAHYGERVGKELYLVCLTVDPETDTPERLKTYAGQVHAGAGWSFLTGERPNVELALAKLGQRSPAKEDHSNILIIGNDATGLWKKALGLAPPVEIIQVVDSVLKDKPK
jgi:protein SCO1